MEPRDRDTHAIIGAAMDVHNILGYGFLEGVYLEALGIELTRHEVPHRVECPLPITYRDMVLTRSYRADLICNGAILVEIKALTRLSGTEDGQILNYLKASGLRKGLLINFGAPRLEYKRFVA